MKVGVVGVGHLGDFHVEQWCKIVGSDNVYCNDANLLRLNEISKKYSIRKFDSINELIHNSDIIDIVTPTTEHFSLAKHAIENNKHVFIEKPVCESVDEVKELIQLQNEFNCIVGVGMIERFNPAYTSVVNELQNPSFFEIHRLAPMNSRGNEVSVLMDLMIHDLDIVLHHVNSNIVDIKAKGVSVINKTPDIANVRIEFENNCVANLTASRISMKKMRKMRVFGERYYTTIDFLNKKSEIFQINLERTSDKSVEFVDKSGNIKFLKMQNNQDKEVNALYNELVDFHAKTKNNSNGKVVSLNESKKVLSCIEQIQNEMN